jgi:hypothetical protein
VEIGNLSRRCVPILRRRWCIGRVDATEICIGGEAMCRSGYQYLYLGFLGDYAGLVLIDWSGAVGSMDSLPRQVDSSNSLISESCK